MSALVSLVMPVWRPRRAWLRDAVAAALDEHACDLELLVVDDGNEQPVAELLDDVDDPRLRIMRIDHAGPYGARNAGIAAARGDFVRFLDGDDLVEPGSTGRLLALAGDEEVLAYGATVMCDEELVPHRVATSETAGRAAEECVLGGFDVFVVSLLFPRTVIERAGPWDETSFSVSGDWDFVLRALEQAPVRPLHETVTYYRRHPASVTKTARTEDGTRAGRLVLDRYFERHPEQRGGTLERRAYARFHIGRSRAHAWSGQRRLVLQQLALAARHDPRSALAALAGFSGERLRARLSLLVARARRRGRRARPRRA
jgi:glycosyltransferase involved in cell wall biosynthesis